MLNYSIKNRIIGAMLRARNELLSKEIRTHGTACVSSQLDIQFAIMMQISTT